MNGASKTITLPQGGTLNVTIPAGVEDGQILRLRGKGAPSPGEGPPGDALVQIVVRPHRYFTREGDDILLDLPITVKEAALGAEVRTPTTTGGVMLKIPKRSNTGDVLRLRGKGVKRRGGRGRRTGQAQSDDADRGRARTRRLPRRLEAGGELMIRARRCER